MKKQPETWFWSHDIKPDQIGSVVMPGTRLVRLSSYGTGQAQRFAALVYKEAGPERSYAVDLDAAQLAARVRDTGARPISITVSQGTASQGTASQGTASQADGGAPRFSVVLETGPGPLSSVHVDLDEAAARALIDDRHGIADLATYVTAGGRRFAVILEERTGPSWLFTGTGPHDLDAKLLELDATLVRLRAYSDGGRPRLCAVAERPRINGWAWYSDLDGDAVARNLEGNAAYPVDLDAVRDDRGVRFTVVMYRGR